MEWPIAGLLCFAKKFRPLSGGQWAHFVAFIYFGHQFVFVANAR